MSRDSQDEMAHPADQERGNPRPLLWGHFRVSSR